MTKILFMGDICLADSCSSKNGTRIIVDSSEGPTPADRPVVVGNIECSISLQGKPLENKYATFRADPASISRLKGLDIAVLANNHVGDYGPEAMLDTRRHLEEAGIQTAGLGKDINEAIKPAIIKRSGISIGILAFSCPTTNGENYAAVEKPGVAPLDIPLIDKALAQARPKVDALFVVLHWGENKDHAPNIDQLRMARHLIDMGVDGVIGTHAHVVQAYEQYNSKWIFYGLGNFLFPETECTQIDNDGSKRKERLTWGRAERESMTAELDVSVEGGKSKVDISDLCFYSFGEDLIPRRINKSSLSFDVDSMNKRLVRFVKKNKRLLSGSPSPVYKMRFMRGTGKTAYFYNTKAFTSYRSPARKAIFFIENITGVKITDKLRNAAGLCRRMFYLLNPAITVQVKFLHEYGVSEDSFNFLEKSQWWSKNELQNYQLEKLKKLVRHAYKNVPYYRKLFDSNNLKVEDIKSLKDLHRIPVLTRENIRDNFPGMMEARNATGNDYKIAKTSGSTAEPLVLYRDNMTTDMSWACMLRFYKWMGYGPGKKMARLWGAALTTPSNNRRCDICKGLEIYLKHRFGARQKLYNAWMMGDKQMGRYARDIRKFRPDVIRGYVSSLVDLVRYCREKGIAGIHTGAVNTTAELLLDQDRQLLSDFFTAPVFDQYGSTEIMSIAYECDYHGALHICDEHCIVEACDDESMPMPAGQEGDLMITDLDNFVMPLIRYKIGDRGSLTDAACGCGRGLGLMNTVKGRKLDSIRGKNDTRVHGSFFIHLLNELKWPEKYKVIQWTVDQESREYINWYIVSKTRPSGPDVENLVRICKEYLGDIDVRIKFVSGIDADASGKRRYTRSSVK